MSEQSVLVLREPVIAAPKARQRTADAGNDRFVTAKARDCFQPVDQVLARLDVSARTAAA